MADELKPVSFYMGAIANKVGEGAKILCAFQEAGVNLIGFLGYPKSARIAEVVFAVEEKTPNLAKIARKAGLELGKKHKALLLTGDNRTGALAKKMAALAEAKINVVSVHGLAGGPGKYAALVVVAAADFRRAAKALGK